MRYHPTQFQKPLFRERLFHPINLPNAKHDIVRFIPTRGIDPINADCIGVAGAASQGQASVVAPTALLVVKPEEKLQVHTAGVGAPSLNGTQLVFECLTDRKRSFSLCRNRDDRTAVDTESVTPRSDGAESATHGRANLIWRQLLSDQFAQLPIVRNGPEAAHSINEPVASTDATDRIVCQLQRAGDGLNVFAGRTPLGYFIYDFIRILSRIVSPSPSGLASIPTTWQAELPGQLNDMEGVCAKLIPNLAIGRPADVQLSELLAKRRVVEARAHQFVHGWQLEVPAANIDVSSVSLQLASNFIDRTPAHPHLAERFVFCGQPRTDFGSRFHWAFRFCHAIHSLSIPLSIRAVSVTLGRLRSTISRSLAFGTSLSWTLIQPWSAVRGARVGLLMGKGRYTDFLGSSGCVYAA